MTTFTDEEIKFITAVFNKPSINPLDPAAVKAVETIQSILRKMNELKENHEPSSIEDRATSDLNGNEQPNGDGKNKAKRQNRASVSK